MVFAKDFALKMIIEYERCRVLVECGKICHGEAFENVKSFAKNNNLLPS